jgi:hypothetical protein
LTAARHGGLRSAIRIKPHSDRSAALITPTRFVEDPNNPLVNVKIAALMAILLVAPIALSYFMKIFRGGGLSRLSACLIGVSSTAIGVLIGYTQLLARSQYFGAHAPLAPELANEVLSVIISEMIVYGVVAFGVAGLLFNFRQRVTP